MKKVIFLGFLLCAVQAFSQLGEGIGFKAGLNYSSNGDYIDGAQNIVEDPMRNIGFHLGFFGKLDLQPLYIRPELVYTRTKSEYNNGDLTISKLDVPLLLGIDLLGPISVFAGPSLQYILDNDFDSFSLLEAENNFTVGAQMGVGLNFQHFGIDLRYERGLTRNEVAFSGISQRRVDTRPDQLILGISAEF